MGKVTDYMPTTDEVRGSLVFLNKHFAEQHADVDVDLLVVESETAAQFDRWLVEVEHAAAAKARGEALIEAVQAHRNLHRAYASTSVCRGGIGGQAITSHCGEVCDNYEAHEKDTEAWTELEVEAIDYSRARAEAYRQERGEQ